MQLICTKAASPIMHQQGHQNIETSTKPDSGWAFHSTEEEVRCSILHNSVFLCNAYPLPQTKTHLCPTHYKHVHTRMDPWLSCDNGWTTEQVRRTIVTACYTYNSFTTTKFEQKSMHIQFTRYNCSGSVAVIVTDFGMDHPQSPKHKVT